MSVEVTTGLEDTEPIAELVECVPDPSLLRLAERILAAPKSSEPIEVWARRVADEWIAAEVKERLDGLRDRSEDRD